MTEPWAWQLPGPRRWTAGITSKIRSGQSVVLEVPRGRARTEVVEAVSAATKLPLLRVESTDLWSSSNQRDVRMILGPAIDPAVVAPSITDLASMAPGYLIELICDDDQPTSTLLEVVEQVSRYSDARTGPRFIIGVPPGSDVAGPRLAAVPYKGVFERHDTAAYVHGRLRQQSEHADEWVTAAITELAAFDLDLADRLVGSWDGEATSIDELLQTGGRTPSRSQREGVLQTRTGSQFEQEWAEGRGDWWDSGRFVSHLQFADDDEVTRRLWFASLRSTWPEIEATRSALINWLASQPYATERLGDEPWRWELSEIAEEIRRYFRMGKPNVLALARDLRDLRNDIAHLRPASAKQRAGLGALIPKAERELP